MSTDSEEDLLRSVALQNAQVVLAARLRAEQGLREAQRELEEHRQLLHAALGAAGAGAFKWHLPEGSFKLGQHLLRLLSCVPLSDGCRLDELAACIDDSERARFVEMFLESAREGCELHGEFRLIAGSTRVRWIEVRGQPVRDEQDAVAGIVGTISDITARRNDARERQESVELLRATFRQAAVGIAIAGLDGRLLEVNDKFVELLGYSRDELSGMSFMEFTHPDDREVTAASVRALVEGAIGEYEMEKRYLRADGSVLWSHTTVTQLRDDEGQPRNFIGAINDITQRKLAEQALQDETRVLETLYRTNVAVASHLDLGQLVQSVTDAATEACGAQFGAFFYYGRDAGGEAMLLHTLSGAPASMFEHLGHPRPTAIFGPTFRGEEIVRSDDILADPRYGLSAPHFGLPPGHPPVRSYLAVPVLLRNNEVIGGLFFGHAAPGMFRERDERVISGIAAQASVALDNARLYEDLRRRSEERERLLAGERAARSAAERAGLMKDEFLSTLSHELRTPLNAVLGWADILLARHEDAEIRVRAAEAIARNARAQSRLIEDLLDMNRIVSGKVRLDVQPMWLDSVIDEALDAVRPSAEAREVTLRKIVDPRAGPVCGDATRLQQVVWNLLSNGVKFTGRGGEVRVQVARVGSDVEITVSDDGIGVEAQFLPHIFDRFRQADSSTTRSVGGLGLGLAIVKQLVELHGGRVRATSEGVGKGTAVVVRLPIAALSARRGGVRAALEDAEPLLEMAPGEGVDLSGLRTLVVDDEPDASAIVALVLEQCGATVVTAASADEAVENLRAGSFDLLVSDIGMPDKDGYELMREVRRLPPGQGGTIPAVALTAFARTEDRTRALLAGYQAHLAKPAEMRALVSTIGELLGRTASR